MFLKPKRVRKDGKTHTYWVLVESVRTPKGPRHRTVAYLGELKPSEQSGWARLGRSLSGATGATYPLFERDDPGEPVPATVEVDVRGVHVQSTRGFGDVYLVLDELLGVSVDEVQVCIGLVVTREGLPVAYEVFAGNRNDVTTVQEIVQTIESKHGQMNRIPVLDRGMGNEENLAYSLCKTLEQWMARSTLGHAPRTVIEEPA